MHIKLVASTLIAILLPAGIVFHLKNSNNSTLIAHTVPENKEGELFEAAVKDADFVFQGVVTKIQYRLSDKASANSPQLPYTYVTFKVDKFFKGNINQSVVTLRFIGGPDGKDNYLTVSRVPLFDIGDKDTLFVKDNGISGCPLVECDSGRLRLIQNNVFTDTGRPLVMDANGDVTYASAVTLEEVRTNKIGSVVLKAVFPNQSSGVDAQQGVNTPASLAVNIPATTITADKLELLIRNQVNRLTAVGQLRIKPFKVSVDPQEKFSIPPTQAASPSLPPSITPASIPQTATDIKEAEILRQNRGNPVLPSSKE